jgi:hypothetical protein
MSQELSCRFQYRSSIRGLQIATLLYFVSYLRLHLVGVCDSFVLLTEHPSKPVLGSIQLPVQWVPGFFSGGKVAGAWRWTPPPPLHQVPRLEKE